MADCSSTSGKRAIRDETDDAHAEGSKRSLTRSPCKIDMNRISKLSLEAIFHPKFENENRELQSIRNVMKEKVSNHAGYLEVSLKHSGNLLLWSGGQRYFSKNATNNTFTYVGEVLLRQHFHRAWYKCPESKSGDAAYQECSDFVEKHRLTLAFEAVTAILGHHGDLPKKDFLILTAVAQKATAQFCGTVEILELAHRFRLPHNDVWVYSTSASVDMLFHLYDSTRETGLADDTVAALNASANAHVSSMFPHAHFQGNILEGIVIRYVAYKEGEQEQQVNLLQKLEHEALETLRKVPIDRPMCFELPNNSDSKLLSLDIRQAFRDCMAQGFDNDLTTRLGDAVSRVLHESDTYRRTITKAAHTNWNIPELAKTLLEKPGIDQETYRIAKLIVRLDEQNATVRYGVFREDDRRWLCTLHVLHDKTFIKFQREMQPGDLHLFRGFSIELGLDDIDGDATMTFVSDDAEQMQVDDSGDARIMLKMKFLPYMVRTFCCRNGLPNLAKDGPSGFATFTWKQMTSWGISDQAKEMWQPFFRAWGEYAHDCMHNVPRDYIDKSLPPMRAEFYLNHLEHFVPLYENGTIQCSDDRDSRNATFRGIVVAVAILKDTAKQVANFVSQGLGGVPMFDCIEDREGFQAAIGAAKGGGLVVSATITDVQLLRNRIAGVGDKLYFILFGCDEKSIEASVHSIEKQLIGTSGPDEKSMETRVSSHEKKLMGLASRWQKHRYATMIIHVAPSSVRETQTVTNSGDSDDVFPFQPSDELKEAVMQLEKLSCETQAMDVRQGLLVFFPGIPGCGKSTLSGAASQRLLTKFLETFQVEGGLPKYPRRELIVVVGDRVKGKYWKQVEELRGKQPASILIADKNAPRSSWSSVGVSAGNGLVVPVLPDSKALSTTRIVGTRDSTGHLDPKVSHFYPFSLHYLAVCMARVMARPAKSHEGGLDCLVDRACLVVTSFFGLYRFVSADNFMDSVQSTMAKSGSMCSIRPIELPFFGRDDLPDLPEELSDALTEALQHQYGFELAHKNSKALQEKSVALQCIEGRLRNMIKKHGAMLLGMTASEAETRSAFVDQVIAHIKSLHDEQTQTPASVKVPLIKLVAIDVCVERLHDELKAVACVEKDFLRALDSIGIDLDNAQFGPQGGFERLPHVTLAHPSKLSQHEIRLRFGSLLGKTVSLSVTGFLRSKRIAALAIKVDATSGDGMTVPESCNDFVHITLWRKGVQAVESNNLPSLVATGDAVEVVFNDPFVIEGTLSYWK